LLSPSGDDDGGDIRRLTGRFRPFEGGDFAVVVEVNSLATSAQHAQRLPSDPLISSNLAANSVVNETAPGVSGQGAPWLRTLQA
jgi:hypothetical protein